ncbi:MAG TPA: addiction module protein [Afifellaceae bacterium]|nr:addiction module protein [Afifellaceae bacterium]
MNEKIRILSEQARQLSPHERIVLVEDVLDSLDITDPAVDRLWAQEARNRLAAYRQGALPANELNDVIAKYRS